MSTTNVTPLVEFARLRRRASALDLQRMEADALEIFARAGVDPLDGFNIGELCRVATGCLPMRDDGPAEAWFAPSRGVTIRRDVPADRANWLVGHELSHWLHHERGERSARFASIEDEEDVCDITGAALVCPEPVMRKLLPRWGRRWSWFAELFGVPGYVVRFRFWMLDRLGVRLA